KRPRPAARRPKPIPVARRDDSADSPFELALEPPAGEDEGTAPPAPPEAAAPASNEEAAEEAVANALLEDEPQDAPAAGQPNEVPGGALSPLVPRTREQLE